MRQWIPLKDYLYFMTRVRTLEGKVYFEMLWKKMHKHPPPE
ncbi:MAG: hypothetical protein ACP5H0_06575 [Caldisericum sp.]